MTTIRLPNSYLDLTDASSQVITTQYDPLMRTVELTTPDAGTTLTLYDQAGNRRFVQDAEGAARGYFGFFLYDLNGRQVASGVVAGDWSLAQAQVDIAGWPIAQKGSPPDSVVYALHSRSAYDGDGNDANAVGQLVHAAVHSGGSVVDATSEAFATVHSRSIGMTMATSRGGAP